MNRRDELYLHISGDVYRRINRAFLWLLLAQWAVLALLSGWRAPLLGATAVVATAAPLLAIVLHPSSALTRQLVACAQLVWSGVLIALTIGHGDTYFHVFGSLAFLACYRDTRAMAMGGLTCVVVTAMTASTPAIFAEHLAWVAFALGVLIYQCHRGTHDMRAAAAREAKAERTTALVESKVIERTQQLEESADRYRALLENTEAVTFEFDTVARRVIYVAPQAAMLLECSLAMLDDPAALAAAIHPEDRERVTLELAALASGDRSWADPIDCRMITQQHRIIHVRTFLSARAGSRRLRGITLDVTRQRRLEQDLQQSQKLESVGRLAAGVAHEINTPIQFVGDSVDFMRGSIDDLLAVTTAQQRVVDAVLAGATAREAATEARTLVEQMNLPYLREQLPRAAERALEGIERVGSIVRSMKTFSHPDAAQMTTVELNRTIETALTIARNEYRYVADLETSLGQLPPVTGHAGDFNQIVLNIVVNAAHAISDVHARSGERGRICVASSFVDGCAVIRISDTGGGIPPHVRDRVFDPFFTTKDVGKGTGQGLAIARGLVVDKYQGTITFETEMGKGTTFIITIPRIRAASAGRRAA